MNKGEYFLYLCEKVRDRGRYSLLLSYLFDTPFKWSYKIPTDANRSKDGQMLRSRYANERGDYILYSDKTERCSVLEMMIALCIRIEEDVMADPGRERPDKWFWKIMENLNLSKMTDRNFDEKTVIDILNRFMSRSYLPNGEGGMFPLKHATKDQRLIPIWDQANSYLIEQLKGELL